MFFAARSPPRACTSLPSVSFSAPARPRPRARPRPSNGWRAGATRAKTGTVTEAANFRAQTQPKTTSRKPHGTQARRRWVEGQSILRALRGHGPRHDEGSAARRPCAQASTTALALSPPLGALGREAETHRRRSRGVPHCARARGASAAPSPHHPQPGSRPPRPWPAPRRDLWRGRRQGAPKYSKDKSWTGRGVDSTKYLSHGNPVRTYCRVLNEAIIKDLHYVW